MKTKKKECENEKKRSVKTKKKECENEKRKLMQDADENVWQTLVLVARIEAEMALTRDVRLKATCLHILICALYVHVTLHEIGVRIPQNEK